LKFWAFSSNPQGKISKCWCFTKHHVPDVWGCARGAWQWQRANFVCPMFLRRVVSALDLNFFLFRCSLSVFLLQLVLEIWDIISSSCNVFNAFVNIDNLHFMSSKTFMSCLACWIIWLVNKRLKTPMILSGVEQKHIYMMQLKTIQNVP